MLREENPLTSAIYAALLCCDADHRLVPQSVAVGASGADSLLDIHGIALVYAGRNVLCSCTSHPDPRLLAGLVLCMIWKRADEDAAHHQFRLTARLHVSSV